MQFASVMLLYKKIVAVWLCTLLFFACKNSNVPSVNHIAANLAPVRYHQLLAALDTNQVPQQMLALAKEHPYFTEVFTQHLTGWGMITDTSNVAFAAVKHFLTYKDYVNLEKTVNEKFPTTKKIDADLTLLCKYIKYYLPNYKIPKLYYFNSGLNTYSAITYDTLIGVGLDMYLGADFPFYASVQIPNYQSARCEPNYIAPNMASSIYNGLFPFDNTGKNLLDMMIQRGKEMYFVHKVLPEEEVNLPFGYTKTQFDWCEKNQTMIWNLFAGNDLLYNTDLHKTMNYVLDGPNSSGLPLECPGNIGSYVGWKIVEAYCKKNPPKNMAAFLKEPIVAHSFLQKSGYKGRE